MNNFCLNPSHTLKNYKFCLTCALNDKPMNLVFYCNKCSSDLSKKHVGHTKHQHLQHQLFTKPYDQFKQLFKNNINEMIDVSEQGKQLDPKSVLGNMVHKPNFYHFFTGETLTDLIKNDKFKMWLLQMKFWECQEKTYLQKVKAQVKQKLSQNQIIKQILQDKNTKKMEKSQFKIVWESIDEYPEDQQQQIQNVNKELVNLQRQKQILHFFLKMYSSFSIQECYACKNICDQLIQKYPDCKILYLAKIRILQLLPKGQKIQTVLNKIANIDQKFIASDLYYYYLAISQWEMIQNKTEVSQKFGIQNMFFETKNKRYYKLKNVDRYIQNMLKAISIKQRCQYYLACAIGHIVKQEYDLSEQYFQKALKQKYQSQSMDNNYIFTQIKNNKFDPDTAIRSLEVRTMQFIKNIAKYFKKYQKYEQLLKCCQIMIARQPKNDKIKIQFVKAILLHGNQKGHANRFKQHIQLASSIIAQLRQAKKSQKQAKQLAKKLALVKARSAWDRRKIQEAVQKFRQIPNKNATDQYNLAASLFESNKEQHDQDIYKQALQSINKAISLACSEKPKYLRLKFYICCYLKDCETARQLSKFINAEQNKDLLQFIQNFLD